MVGITPSTVAEPSYPPGGTCSRLRRKNAKTHVYLVRWATSPDFEGTFRHSVGPGRSKQDWMQVLQFRPQSPALISDVLVQSGCHASTSDVPSPLTPHTPSNPHPPLTPGMPVGGISPDRMDPWLAFYGEALLGLNEGEFGLLYSAHAGEKVDMKVPVFQVPLPHWPSPPP